MNFGKERDAEYLFRENAILKKENSFLTEQLIDKNTDIEATIMEVITLQRERIDNLENEYDALYDKYEELMRMKTVTADDTFNK